MTDALFQPIQLGSLSLKNRIVMPPMTRSRASQPGNVANDMMATYYAQRAEAGLIVAEGTQISPMGQGYAWTPGIYSSEQIAGWKKVTDAVHEKGGVIFAQLWHVGRVTHPDNIGGEQPISSSALKAENVKVFIDNGTDEPGFVDVVEPREMTKQDIKNVIEEYRQAALNAIKAGFDGVELHAANGYLVNQFIDSEANNRTDEYGGSIENRLRHDFKTAVREAYKGTLIYAGRYNAEKAQHAIESGLADMIGFGRPFVANPDLPSRIKHGYPLAEHDLATLFGGGEKGLVDYPAYHAG
ncbi:alkene reductase [Vibrio parahaemolyticus]|uniref:alkene reductase n=1 Tax=Vibrio parahaemolyticus TaxID=670 RepID=UPI000A376F49|nr:alkene reductase [Vibrio parahaemolyticus]MBY7717502.1 alkene reductase [Vibrio parahaemolyticus]MCZ6372841.1 alkene reductase [Vibrio parahaemolyticus]MDF4660780.1 alkene reductase [Vibrio parahaemolyticus]OUJ29039.1 alkene reductase [Vibrio parahaemolyticus]TBT61592.1 alkene reductase [Vibrio parahaemolyticus]